MHCVFSSKKGSTLFRSELFYTKAKKHLFSPWTSISGLSLPILRFVIKQLIDDAVFSKEISVSDDDVNRYLMENWNRLQTWNGSMQDLRKRIFTYLKQQKSPDKLMAYAKSLQTLITDTIEANAKGRAV